MLSIDEAIANERDAADIARGNIINSNNLDGYEGWNNSQCIKCAEEYEQIAEWLEELKALKNGLNIKCDNLNEALEKGKKIGYNNGIDDFVKFASTMPTVEQKDGTIRPMWLEEMAEKLKAGGIDETI